MKPIICNNQQQKQKEKLVDLKIRNKGDKHERISKNRNFI